MSNSMKSSSIYWQGLRAVLTGTKLSALQYNKLIYQLTEWSFEQEESTTMEIPFVLLDSPVEVVHPQLCSSLKRVTEKMLSDGLLTGSQRALAIMAAQKLRKLDLASPIDVE